MFAVRRTIRRSCWLLIATSCLAASSPLAQAAESTTAAPGAAFLESHCADCHQGEGAEGDFDWSELSPDLSDAAVMQRWVRVIDRVTNGEMPPPDAGEVDDADRNRFVESASSWLRREQSRQHERSGRVPLRRLNHQQVERTLHDLLAIDPPLASLVPADTRTDGYTTIADGQPMSHFQLQSHLTIVDAALDHAFARAIAGEDPWQREWDAKELSRKDPKRRSREPELIDDLAVTWASRLIFYGRLPATRAREAGWYEITFRASAVKKPEDHGVWCTVRSGECVSSAPLMAWIGGFEAEEEAKRLRFVAWLPEGHMLEIRPGDRTLKQAKFAGGQVGTGEGHPQDVAGVALHELRMKRIHPGGTAADVRRQLWGDCESIFLDGTSEEVRSAEARQRIEQQIAAFASRAFRRPATEPQWKPYAALFHELIDAGESPHESLKACYRAVLCSPRFLYFQETPGALDDHAIASRLSYFLTGSAPDETLLKWAASGKLREPEILRQEVLRLLAPPHHEAFIARFADQWLDLVEIDFTEPDPKLHREFDPLVQHAMLAETRAYLADLFQRDASVSELIHSEHTFANSRLARYYELTESVAGDEFRRVRLHPQDHRGGILGQGAILKVTANGTHTSPVVRGVWLCRRLLGETIPPPPAGIPAIEPDVRGTTTIREQLEKHRADVNCSSCHSKIDPAGFALETFDAAGRVRTKYLQMHQGKLRPRLAIDSSATLADGRRFGDFAAFQQLISDDVRPIARNLVEHLLTFSTGAPPTFADRPEIAEVVERCAENDYGMASLLVETVCSPIFQRK